MNRKMLFVFIAAGISFLFGQETSEKEKFAVLARQQFDKGVAAIENAGSDEDFKSAINIFKNALTNSMYGGIYTELSSSIHYNLGMLYDKIEDYDMANHYFTMYISSSPPPVDIHEVEDIIKELEYKSGQFLNPSTLEGVWYYSIPKESSEPRLELRYNKNSAKLEARCLTSEAWEDKIPAGAFVVAEWNIYEKKLTVTEAPYYSCDKSVDPNWCPGKITVTLVRTGENKLEGELISTGIVYQDLNNPEMFTSSGKVVFERYK